MLREVAVERAVVGRVGAAAAGVRQVAQQVVERPPERVWQRDRQEELPPVPERSREQRSGDDRDEAVDVAPELGGNRELVDAESEVGEQPNADQALGAREGEEAEQDEDEELDEAAAKRVGEGPALAEGELQDERRDDG